MAIVTGQDEVRSELRFAIQECWLGRMLVAASQQGLCAILLGEESDALTSDLERRFSTSVLRQDEHSLKPLLADVVGFIECPSLGLATPLDLRGTAFQLRVWEALRDIPSGTTTSYSEIAQQIDRPQAVRAVAQACGANPVAVVIPCHRVVRRDGSLSGYRWGIQRKRQLLRREQQLLVASEFDAGHSSLATNCTASTMT